jgi:hypothetical protein
LSGVEVEWVARSIEDCKGFAAELPKAELPEAGLPEAELPEAGLPELSVLKVPWIKPVPPAGLFPAGLLLKLLELDAESAEVGAEAGKPDIDPLDAPPCGLDSAKGFGELDGWLAADGIEVDPSDPRLPG